MYSLYQQLLLVITNLSSDCYSAHMAVNIYVHMDRLCVPTRPAMLSSQPDANLRRYMCMCNVLKVIESCCPWYPKNERKGLEIDGSVSLTGGMRLYN